jgi:hypothetical protein
MKQSGRRRGTHCRDQPHAATVASTLELPETTAITEARTIITELVRAHEKGQRLAKELMVAQELADAAETKANYAVAIAASDPDNRDAIRRAIWESERSEAAEQDEMTALARWGEHLLSVSRLIAAIDDLRWLDGPRRTPELRKSPLPRSARRNPPHGFHGVGPIEPSSD